MITINTLLYGLVAGLVGLKIALLAVAAVLFVYTLTERTRQHEAAPAPVRRKRLDVQA
ncbi:MAG: hypothetical protein WBN08_04535 [Thiogranum sp.]